MRYTVIFLLLFITILNSRLTAQVPSSPPTINEEVECDTEPTQIQVELMDRTRAVRERMKARLSNSRAAPIELKIKAHVIRQSSTTPLEDSDIEEDEVDASISQATDAFAQAGISFVRQGNINYIYETPGGPDIYPILNRTSDDAVDLATTHYVDGAINVFFVRGLVNDSGDICGNATYPSSSPNPLRRVFIGTGYYTKGTATISDDVEVEVEASCALNGSTLAHEIGHYFFLHHTHRGNEFVARSNEGGNCGPGVGDELCDTPADPHGRTGYPGIKSCINQGDPCTYDNSGACNAVDDQGNEYNPDPTNIMSYGLSNCRTFFSKGQINRMLVSLKVDRSELLDNTSDCALFEIFDESKVYNAGLPKETNEVSWKIQSQATVKGESVPDSGNGAKVEYSAGGFILLHPPFKAEYTSTFLAHIEGCEQPTNLKIRDEVQTNSIVTNLNVYPNPFSNRATIDFNLLADSQVSISIFDLMGSKINNIVNGITLKAGVHKTPIVATNLPAGIYYCTVQTGDYISTKKIVLTK